MYYQTIQKLGDGVFGTVVKAIDQRSNEIVAIKTYRDSVRDETKIKEIQILKQLDHNNIIKLREVLKQNRVVSIVLDYSDRNLLQFYDQVKAKNRTFPEQQIQSIVYQIADALSYLHGRGFLHRDLKPENIMIQDNGIVKLIDFGQVTYQHDEHTDYVSTRWYRSPEQIRLQKYNQEIDIWAMGCIIAELYLLTPIFPGNTEIDQLYIMENMNLDQYSKIIPPQPLSLIKQMLQLDPLLRISAVEILQSHWLDASYKFLPKELGQSNPNRYMISPSQTPVKQKSKYTNPFQSKPQLTEPHQQFDDDLDCQYIPSYITDNPTRTTTKKRNIKNEAQSTFEKNVNYYSKPLLFSTHKKSFNQQNNQMADF